MSRFALFTTIDLFGLSTVSGAFVGGHSAETEREQPPEAQPSAVQSPAHRSKSESLEGPDAKKPPRK